MKTIDELNETTSTEGLYVLGSQNNQSVKYNIGSAIDKIDECNDIIGGGSVQDFSPLKKYYPGQFVSYQDKIYKFIQIHLAGEWNPNDVEETSIFGELQGLVENVTVTISGLSDLGNKQIVIYVEGEPNPRSLTTNSLGQVETSINKGLTYSVYPQSYGNYIVQNYLNIKASLNERYINIPYQQSQAETCTLEVNIIVSGIGGSINNFIGQTLTIFNESNQQTLTAIIDNTGKATFNNVTKYTTYTIYDVVPAGGTYKKLTTNTIITNFNINTVNLECIRINGYGLFLVNGNDWSETEITQEFIDTLNSSMKSTYPLIHVCTEDLANFGCDYYMRCRDLTSERLATECTKKWWSTELILYPNVYTNTSYTVTETSYNGYNGKKSTYYMLYDSANLGISSPAAEFANSQSIEINGKIVNGYIGTRAQLNIIYSIGSTLYTNNMSMIYNTLTNLGYSPDINTSSVWDDAATVWSSSQNNATYAWNKVVKSWGNGNNNKKNNCLVIPFFSL